MKLSEYKQKIAGLFLNIYLNVKENYSNPKIDHFPSKEYKAIFFMDSYDSLDPLYEELTGESLKSKDNYFSAVQPMSIEKGLAWIVETLNAQQKSINQGLLKAKKLEYQIYGYQNPHILPQPEYHI